MMGWNRRGSRFDNKKYYVCSLFCGFTGRKLFFLYEFDCCYNIWAGFFYYLMSKGHRQTAFSLGFSCVVPVRSLL